MSTADLELWILFSLLVAGKSEAFATKVLSRLVDWGRPFDSLRDRRTDRGGLAAWLKACGTGRYAVIEAAVNRLLAGAIADLATCTVADLEAVPGVGPKTAHMFLLKTRPGARYAALDRHVLAWLRRQGHDVPLSTPTGPRYRAVEVLFLSIADTLDLDPAALDYAIWDTYARRAKKRKVTHHGG